MELSLKDGEFLVKLARKAVEEYLRGNKIITPPKNAPKNLYEKAGVFVTINKVVSGKRFLRGCIGFPRPYKPLIEALIESAINSAVNDPRFPPMGIEELDSVIFEVSVLTPPVEIKVSSPLDYPKKIVIGRDGLMIEKSIYSGLLLPQVPVEYGWSPEEFLSQLCLKAGLLPDAWLDEDVRIYRFSAIIFEEEEPKGKVIKKALMEGNA